MSPRWRKILGDYRAYRGQFAIIGLVLLLGTGAVVAAMNAQAILAREIKQSYARSNSPDLALRFEQADPKVVDEILGFEGVANADLRRVISTQVLGRDDHWRPMRLVVVRDFANQQVGLFHRDDGTGWPANDAGILIEQSSLTLLREAKGGDLQVRTPGGGTATVPFAGSVHDTALAPGFQEGMIYAYATPAIAARLGQGEAFDQIVVQLADRRFATKLVGELSDWLATKGPKPLRTEILNNSHPHAMLMSAMLKVLQTFAILAFICSAALAAYVISLWMKREVRQIGIMKTLGARWPQLAGIYLGLVTPLVVLALVLAWPLGQAVALGVVRYYRTMLNIDVASTAVPAGLLLGESLVALAVPLCAMALPILRAIRLSPREAIQEPGIAPLSTTGRLASRWFRLPGDRRGTFALRNTFRRPWRLAVSVLALSVGGALLLTARNNYESLMRVVDTELAKQGHDLEVYLQRPATAAQLEPFLRGFAGRGIVEPWRVSSVTLVPPAGDTVSVTGEAHRFQLFGHPADTRLLTMPLVSGRWPQRGETGAVVINRNVQLLAPEAQVGGEFTVQFRGRPTTLRVVGLVEEIGAVAIYAPVDTFEAITGLGDAAGSLRFKAAPATPLEPLLAEITAALVDARLAPSLILSRADRREVLEEHFHVIVDISLMIALAAAVVGGISLAAFASLNVLERAREIGVIRTIGATPRTVVTLFFIESGVVAGLSAVLAIAIGIGGTLFLNNLASRQLLHVAVPLYLSRLGHGALAAGLLLVLLGVWLTVRRQLRLSIRETLAYE